MKVMVVDDEPDIVDLLSLMLGSHDYGVITAYSGNECLEKLQEGKPDLILLDLVMPDIDGWEVLSRIRQDAQLKAIPVVIITAKQLTAEVAQKKAPYLTEYLVKPITNEGLISVIEDIISASKQLEDFVSAATDAGIDQGLIDKYIHVNQQTEGYKRMYTSLVQIYTKKRLKRDESAKNTMNSIKRVIDLNERNLAKLRAEIEEKIAAR